MIRNAQGRFVASTPDDLEALRADYEGNLIPLKAVCVAHELSMRTLQRLVIQGGWRQRQPRRIDRNDLIMRMFRLLDAQSRQMENDMDKNVNKAGAAEAAVLVRMVSSLDRLIAIKDAETGRNPVPKRRSKAMDILRSRIAERIAELNQH